MIDTRATKASATASMFERLKIGKKKRDHQCIEQVDKASSNQRYDNKGHVRRTVVDGHRRHVGHCDGSSAEHERHKGVALEHAPTDL